MAKPTSPPPTPSKPVTPQLAAPKPAAPQPVTLQAAAFADLPGWQADDHLAALKTFVKSCDKVIKGIPGAPDDAASVALADACRAAIAIKSPTKASAKAFFESRFVPNRVIHTGELRSPDRLLRAGARRLAHARRALPDARSTGGRPISSTSSPRRSAR